MKKIELFSWMGFVLASVVFFNTAVVCAELTVVDADQDAINILLYMKCFEDRPFLLFAQQRSNIVNGKGIDLLRTLDRMNFIFKNSGPKDLAVTMAFMNEFFFFNYEGVYEFDVPDVEVLEIFCLSEKDAPSFQLKIDETKVADFSCGQKKVDSSYKKYFKIWSGHLAFGRHIIVIDPIEKDKTKENVLKLVFVDQKNRIVAEHIISEKMTDQENKTSYIFEDESQDFLIP